MNKRNLLAAGVFVALGLAASHSFAEGDAEKGKQLYNQCAACHAVEEGVNKIGPSLYGVMGQEAGAVEGFNYSDALANADLTWNAETLDAYLADPRGYIPGNRMPYAGMPDAQDRADVIAYLKTLGAE